MNVSLFPICLHFKRGVTMEKRALTLIGKRVREKRKERGLSQEQLGEKAGLHFSYIGGVERSEKNITVSSLQKIADALEVDIHELLKGEDNTFRKRTERDETIFKINQYLWSMSLRDLKKVIVFLTEIIGKRE
jgi:transcriptional regulator with XRE-family HTH domain